MTNHLLALIGGPAFSALCAEFGGQTITVPTTKSARLFARLVAAIGEDAACKFQHHYKGDRLYIRKHTPKALKASKTARRDALRKMRRDGLTLSQIQATYREPERSLSDRQIRAALKGE